MLSKLSLFLISIMTVGTAAVVNNAWTQSASNDAYFVGVDSNDKGDLAYACAKDANGYPFKGGIYASKDYGVTFEVTSAPSTLSCSVIATDSVGQNVFAGLSDGFYVSADAGSTWQKTLSLVNASSTWSSVATSSNGQYVYAGVLNENKEGGMYASSNFGVSWYRIWEQTGSDEQVRTVATDSTGKYVMVGMESKLVISHDFGETYAKAPLSAGYGMILAVAASSSGQYMAATQVGRTSVLTSQDFGKTWTVQAGSFLLNSLDSSAGGDFLIGGYDNYGPVYTSTDFGVDWVEGSIKSMTDVATDSTGKYLLAASPLKIWYYASSTTSASDVQK